MKKIFCLMLIFAFFASLIACQAPTEQDSSKDILDITSDIAENTSCEEENSSAEPTEQSDESDNSDVSSLPYASGGEEVTLTVSPSYDNDTIIPLTKNEEKIIIGHILSVENWINDNCDCIYDCVFRLHKDGKDIKIGYSLTCGTLNVFETPRSCQLSESAKEEIGAILTPRILPFADC